MKNTYTFQAVIIFIVSIASYSNSFSQLSGNYTVGSGGSFPTITAAVTSLNSNGISGPVSLLILPGIYEEQLVIGAVTGTSQVNTITIRSVSGDTGSVIWKANNIGQNYIIKITGTNNLTIRGIKFQNTFDSVNVVDVIVIDPLSYNISVINNIFNINIPYQIDYQNCILINASSGNVNNLFIHKNVFKADARSDYDSRYGILINGLNSNLVISDNSFSGLRHSIELSGVNSPMIERNNISTGGSFDIMKGVVVNACPDFKISKNKFYGDGSIFGGFMSICLEVNNYCGTSSLIVNNFIKVNDNSLGILIEAASGANLYFNTIYSNSQLSRNITISNSSSLNVKDNLIVYPGVPFRAGVPYTMENSLTNSDYNNFYNTVLYVAEINDVYVHNIQELVALTGNDSNSNVEPVQFVSDQDFHLSGTSIGNNLLKGIPISGINEDIDGNPRNPVAPYKGADEPQPPLTLHLTFLVEGFYNNILNSQVSDTVTGYFRSSVSPYSIVDSARGVVSPAGNANLIFNHVIPGTYYIVVKHRNSIETWSNSGNLSGNSLSYNFTTSQAQAFGNNLVLKGTKYCIYSGDVNQDGFADATDVLIIYNDAYNYSSGYLPSDLNGDNISDLSDMLICYNNSVAFVKLIRP